MYKKTVSVLLVATLILLSLPLTAFASGRNEPANAGLTASGGRVIYVDSIDGDDANDGNSPASALKTIAGFMTYTEQAEGACAGLSVEFRCGGRYECSAVWKISGTADDPVVITSYGSGPKPILCTDGCRDVLTLNDSSHVRIRGLEITAPDGGGMHISAPGRVSEDIGISDCDFINIQYTVSTSRRNQGYDASGGGSAILVKYLGDPSPYGVNDLSITDCRFLYCGQGLMVWGSQSRTGDWAELDEPDPAYNERLFVSGCEFNYMDSEAIIVGICRDSLVTDCKVFHTCRETGLATDEYKEFANAPVWFWGSTDSVIQKTEIAYTGNIVDGMAVDFDSDSNNCTYQYIYSHDNTCFIRSCPLPKRAERNDTVRYCLSVNDNRGVACLGGAGKAGMDNMKFYNNTIINCGDFVIYNGKSKMTVANNIFAPAEGSYIIYDNNNFKNLNLYDYSHNCFYKTAIPYLEKGSVFLDPLFTGSGKEADGDIITADYRLSSGSPLIGRGIAVEGSDEVSEDFFGDPVTSLNIGCYGGGGESTSYSKNGMAEFMDQFLSLFKSIMSDIKYYCDIHHAHIVGWLQNRGLPVLI